MVVVLVVVFGDAMKPVPEGFGNQGLGKRGSGNQGFGNPGLEKRGSGNQGVGKRKFENPELVYKGEWTEW